MSFRPIEDRQKVEITPRRGVRSRSGTVAEAAVRTATLFSINSSYQQVGVVSNMARTCFDAFGQSQCLLDGGTSLSRPTMLGLHRVCSTPHIHLGPLALGSCNLWDETSLSLRQVYLLPGLIAGTAARSAGMLSAGNVSTFIWTRLTNGHPKSA